MYFFSVRPFEEIYRQGEQQPGGQQQNSGQAQQGANVGQAQELVELQKQVIFRHMEPRSARNPGWRIK